MKEFDLTNCIQPIQSANGLSVMDVAGITLKVLELASVMRHNGYDRHLNTLLNMATNLLDEQDYLLSMPRVAYTKS
ncbi:hypothetical protein [Caudoviricetes sp.]|nr:hypothetical protein [Caudoviricetes sp.]